MIVADHCKELKHALISCKDGSRHIHTPRLGEGVFTLLDGKLGLRIDEEIN